MMKAKEIHETIKNMMPWWEREDGANTEKEDIAHIQLLLDDGLEDLYNAMTNDLLVMSEHCDDENDVLFELVTADSDTINYYKDMYL